MPGVSSMWSGRPATSRLTCTKRSKSRWAISPRRMRSAEMRASSASRRRASCSALISSVKRATAPLGISVPAPPVSAARASMRRARAAPKAILVASADLPMPGRPAMISRSDGCRPPVFLSRSRSPVVRPDTWPGRWNARSAPWMAVVSAFSNTMRPVPPVAPRSAMSNRRCSAASTCCLPSISASAPNALFTTSSPTSISSRRSQESWMARPYSPALMMPTMAVNNWLR